MSALLLAWRQRVTLLLTPRTRNRELLSAPSPRPDSSRRASSFRASTPLPWVLRRSMSSSFSSPSNSLPILPPTDIFPPLFRPVSSVDVVVLATVNFRPELTFLLFRSAFKFSYRCATDEVPDKAEANERIASHLDTDMELSDRRTSTAAASYAEKGTDAEQGRVDVPTLDTSLPASNPKKKSESLLWATLKQRTTIFVSIFVFLYVGAEVSMGGWIVTFIIENRAGGVRCAFLPFRLHISPQSGVGVLTPSLACLQCGLRCFGLLVRLDGREVDLFQVRRFRFCIASYDLSLLSLA